MSTRDDIASGEVWPDSITCSICGETRGAFLLRGDGFVCLRHLPKLGVINDRRVAR